MQTFFLRLFLLFFLTQICHCAVAANLSVELRTADNKSMPNAVIYLTPLSTTATVQPSAVAIMDQIDRQFAPHILVVQKNTPVRFPNSDSIKHHVYSFSDAFTFELQLYRGLDANPLLLSKLGVVELGCNIHDWMLGYIVVVDTPYFAKTSINGQAQFTLPEGDYRLNIWHPRILQSKASLEHSVMISENNKLVFKLDKPLRPNVNQYETLPADINDYE